MTPSITYKIVSTADFEIAKKNLEMIMENKNFGTNQKVSVPVQECGLSYTLKLVAGKWKPTIIWEIHQAPLRFGELKRRLPGISDKVLSSQLRDLEKSGIIERKDLSEAILHVEYGVTPMGASLNEALHCLSLWGNHHSEMMSDNIHCVSSK